MILSADTSVRGLIDGAHSAARACKLEAPTVMQLKLHLACLLIGMPDPCKCCRAMSRIAPLAIELAAIH